MRIAGRGTITSCIFVTSSVACTSWSSTTSTIFIACFFNCSYFYANIPTEWAAIISTTIFFILWTLCIWTIIWFRAPFCNSTRITLGAAICFLAWITLCTTIWVRTCIAWYIWFCTTAWLSSWCGVTKINYNK